VWFVCFFFEIIFLFIIIYFKQIFQMSVAGSSNVPIPVSCTQQVSSDDDDQKRIRQILEQQAPINGDAWGPLALWLLRRFEFALDVRPSIGSDVPLRCPGLGEAIASMEPPQPDV
jgi:hypothetical protein